MKYTFGLGFLGVGVYILLSSFGIIHTSLSWIASQYWPLILVIGGLEIFIRSLRRGRAEVFFPLLMIVVGAFLQLQQMQYLNFMRLIHPWALIIAFFLIYLGLVTITSSFRRSKHRHFKKWSNHGKWEWKDWDMRSDTKADKVWEESDLTQPPNPHRHHSKGEIRFGDGTWVLEPMDIRNPAGQVRINLGTASIPEGETPITVRAGFGDVHIHVPHDVAVKVRAHIIGGELRVFDQRSSGIFLSPLPYTDSGYEEASKRIRIDVSLKFGEVRIVRVN
jgi:predicted membrane protein